MDVPPAPATAPVRGSVWNVRYQLTDDQRDKDLRPGTSLVGCTYDYPAYADFALEVLKLRSGAQVDPGFREDRWRVCSALVAGCYAYAGADLEEGLKYPNLISPGRPVKHDRPRNLTGDSQHDDIP